MIVSRRKRSERVVLLGSLLAVAALAALWVRSKTTVDVLSVAGPEQQYSIVSERGRVALEYVTFDYTPVQWMLAAGLKPPQPHPGWRIDWHTDQAEEVAGLYIPGRLWWMPYVNTHVASIWFSESPPFAEGGQLVIPTSYLLALCALPWIVMVLGRMRTAARSRAGRCVNCGYDLRASNDACPECGAGVLESHRHG